MAAHFWTVGGIVNEFNAKHQTRILAQKFPLAQHKSTTQRAHVWVFQTKWAIVSAAAATTGSICLRSVKSESIYMWWKIQNNNVDRKTEREMGERGKELCTYVGIEALYRNSNEWLMKNSNFFSFTHTVSRRRAAHSTQIFAPWFMGATWMIYFSCDFYISISISFLA